MDLQTEKIELAKRLLDTEDEALLEEVKAVFESREKDFWDDLPQYVKDGIATSRKQIEQRLLTPHEEVMKKYKKYL